MKARRDPDTIIKSFLDDGLDELPERSYDAVRAAVDQTRQWAVIGRWKEPQIMTATRFALVAAAIAVLAVVAIRFLPASGGFGLQPVATPSAPPTPAASPLSLTVTGGGPVAIHAGTYFVGNPFLVPFEATVPSGWSGNIGGPYAVFFQKGGGPANVSLTTDQSLYADVCHSSAGFLAPSPGPAGDDLATALAAVRGLTSTQPTPVSIGSYSGKQVTLTMPATTSGCDLASDSGGEFRLWRLPLGGTEDIGPGMTERLWIVNVGGQRVVIQTSEAGFESATDKADAQAIIDSIALNP